ncbi:hypothetical protein D9M72_447250 [compost metagenome]
MGEHGETVIAPDAEAGAERLQLQRAHVHPAADGRVGGIQHLEPAVHQETVHLFRADPASDVVGCFPHLHVTPGGLQFAGTLEPREPGTDHQDFTRIGHGSSWHAGAGATGGPGQPFPATLATHSGGA